MYYVDGALPLYKFELFRDFESEIAHGISTRKGGVSSVAHLASLNLGLASGDTPENLDENYRRFADAVGFPVKKLVIANQKHTNIVLSIKVDNPIPGDLEFDGIISNLPGLPIMVRFADCQGALFYDPVARVIAAVHCGWRGNAQNILGKTVAQMVADFHCDPRDILVGIGPSLEPEAAEFSDPFNELPAEMHTYIDKKNCVNLWQCSSDQLEAEGVRHIEISKIGTYSQPEKFFSFRYSGGKMGHMGGAIMLT